MHTSSRGFVWRKFNLNGCTGLYFSEMYWFREHCETTMYYLITKLACEVKHVADTTGRPGTAESCNEDQQGSTDDPHRCGSTPGQQGMCQVPAVAWRGASQQADGQIGSHTWREPKVCFRTKSILRGSGISNWIPVQNSLWWLIKTCSDILTSTLI